MKLRARRSYKVANAFRWFMVIAAVVIGSFLAVTTYVCCQFAFAAGIFWNPDIEDGPVWWLFGWLKRHD